MVQLGHRRIGALAVAASPATAVGSEGARYVAYQRGSQLSVTRNGGRTWAYVGGSNAANVLSRNTTR